MSLQPWKKQSEEVLSSNKWSSYHHAKFELPDGYIADYYFLKIPDSVVVIGIDSDGSMPIVRQYRCLSDEFTYEFPNGGIDVGISLEQAVSDEFAQEAQMKAKVFEKIGSFHTNNGRVQETCNVFVAYGLSPTFMRKDPTEEFEQLSVTPETFEEMIRFGDITDGMMLAAWQLAKNRVLEIIKQKLNK
jgi:8-oxo-dGTP pyrophosphatase MutT (NUDIX family)